MAGVPSVTPDSTAETQSTDSMVQYIKNANEQTPSGVLADKKSGGAQ